jgi:hypothetical protein
MGKAYGSFSLGLSNELNRDGLAYGRKELKKRNVKLQL